MSSFLCFICHSTVNSDTNEETREKYREVVGINLCPDSHLCHICCHVLNKLWLFKSICLKRSLEYPVLFSEKGTLNLQRNDLEVHTLCPEDICGQYQNRNINTMSYHFNFNNFIDNFDCHHDYNIDNNQYVELEDDRNEFDDYFNINDVVTAKEVIFESKHVQTSVEPVTCQSKEVQTETEPEKLEPNDVQNTESNNDSVGECLIQDNDEIEAEANENLDSCTEPNEIINNYIDDTGIEDTNIGNYNETIENDTNNVIHEENTVIPKDTVKKKHKSRKSKKKGFVKITLSLEQQKAELEGKRKEKKYIEAEFKCYNCALGFLFKDTYQTHMMRHEESNGEYRCSTCTLRFATAGVLRAHRAAHAERLACARCGAAVRPRARPAHARRCGLLRAELAACHLCATIFQDASSMQQHLKRFHQAKTSNRVYSCSVCGKSYNNQAAVRTHMIKHINRKFNCDKCKSTFSSPYTLNEHKKRHESPGGGHHRCNACDVAYSSRKSLLAHRRNALNHQHTVFECPICARVCPNERSLASHIQSVHSSTKNYACPSCPARYSNRKSLVRHIGTHDSKPEAKLAVCHLCGARFKGNNKLNRHLREVCEKAKLEEEFSNLYDQACMNPA